MADTKAPVPGYLVSGVRPNRDNTTFPDAEQKRREQARDETRWARGLRATHPSYTRTNSDTNPGVVGNSNLTRAQSEAANETFTE